MSSRTPWAGSVDSSSSEEAKLLFMDFQRLDKSMDSNSAAAFWSFLPAGESVAGAFFRADPKWGTFAAKSAEVLSESESGNTGDVTEPPDRNSERLLL